MLNVLGNNLLKIVLSNQIVKQHNISKFFSNTIHDISIPASSTEINSLHVQLLGQPTSWTHPHLLGDGEITPKIKLDEYKKRRFDLMQLIKKDSSQTIQNVKNHMVIIPSGSKKYMSGSIPYVFRQNTDFNYLTGCQEPDSMLIITIDENDIIHSIMLMRPKDSYAELWDGPRTGIDNAVKHFGVDEALNIGHLKNIFNQNVLGELLKSPTILWYDELTLNQENAIEKLSNKIIHNDQLHNPVKCIHNLRVIKSESEMQLMRITCQIASKSINDVIRETKIGDSEHHVFARVDFNCRMRNANFLAYPPVVASGKNATSIHYISNNQLVKDKDLILMDAGCDYGGYCSDITRTWPANGQFTNAQRTLYDIILVLQKELIKTISTDYGQNLDQLFEYNCFKLGLYLQEIGIVPKDLTGTALSRAGYNFCPHHVSHYLGMDVHDTQTFSRSEKIRPGMVFTVEPGIYIPSNCETVPKEFRGIGIRIEDDILISSNGVEVLTEQCVKNTDDLENLFKE